MECGLVRETRFVEEKNRGPRSLKFFRISFKSYVSASQKKNVISSSLFGFIN